MINKEVKRVKSHYYEFSLTDSIFFEDKNGNEDDGWERQEASFKLKELLSDKFNLTKKDFIFIDYQSIGIISQDELLLNEISNFCDYLVDSQLLFNLMKNYLYDERNEKKFKNGLEKIYDNFTLHKNLPINEFNRKKIKI
jgi:hypothetical protein